jgi:hypothetical protein
VTLRGVAVEINLWNAWPLLKTSKLPQRRVRHMAIPAMVLALGVASMAFFASPTSVVAQEATPVSAALNGEDWELAHQTYQTYLLPFLIGVASSLVASMWFFWFIKQMRPVIEVAERIAKLPTDASLRQYVGNDPIYLICELQAGIDQVIDELASAKAAGGQRGNRRLCNDQAIFLADERS